MVISRTGVGCDRNLFCDSRVKRFRDELYGFRYLCGRGFECRSIHGISKLPPHFRNALVLEGAPEYVLFCAYGWAPIRRRLPRRRVTGEFKTCPVQALFPNSLLSSRCHKSCGGCCRVALSLSSCPRIIESCSFVLRCRSD